MTPLALLLGLSCRGPTPAPAPAAWTPAPAPADDLLYLVMVDRFADGVPDAAGTTDRGDPQAFHGGDLQGVIDRLDHLEQLGVRTVWLTPVTAMRTEKVDEHGAFHGYWVNDPTRVEPRFGDADLLRALSDGLHARGMRLALDVVWNHQGWDAPLRASHPDWFHQNGDITDWNDPVQLVVNDVHGLPDLAVEAPAVRAYLEAATDWLIETGRPDALRVDAVRHLPNDFVAGMSARLKERHGAAFTVLAEDFQGDALALSRNQRAAGYDRVFDFPLRYALVDSVCHDAGPGRLAGALALDRLYDDPASLVTFLDNHDLPRLASECGGDADRAALALGALFLLRGTPCLSWGTEQLIAGEGEPANRQSMGWDRPMPLAALITELAGRRAGGASTRIVDLGPTWIAWQTGSQRALLNLGATPVDANALPVEASAAWQLENSKITDLPEGAWATPLAPRSLRVWTAPDAPVDRTPTAVQVRVEADLPPGSDLRLVGAGPELGHWDPRLGLRLSRGNEPGTYETTLSLDPTVPWEWKLVANDGSADVWERCPNRVRWQEPSWAARWEACDP